MQLRYNNKGQLIAALEKRRAEAQLRDREVKRKHEKQESERIQEFKKDCKKYAAMSNERLKKEEENRRFGFGPKLELPGCPASLESKIDQAIKTIERSHQETFTIARDGVWNFVYELLTFDLHEERVC